MIDRPQRKAEGLYRWRGMIWSKARARKGGECWLSGRTYVGGSHVYLPLSNGHERHRRVLADVMEGA